MTDMTLLVKMKHRDINSILFFLVYMKLRKISSTSTFFDCSQSKVSTMLKKFCSYFPEIIFERRSRSFTPTPYAFVVYEKCEELILALEETMRK